MVLGRVILHTHGFFAHGISCNGAHEILGIFHCNVVRELSIEGSLGQSGQGFGQG